MDQDKISLRIALVDEIENFNFLKSKIRDEGFHYCFTHYSDFREIQDEEFHKLRKEYLLSSAQLLSYVETKFKELSEKLDEIDDHI